MSNVVSVSTERGGDFENLAKEAPDYSGHIESQVTIGYLGIDGGVDARTLKGNIAYYLTEQIAGRLPRKGMMREGRESTDRPFVTAEIESAM